MSARSRFLSLAAGLTGLIALANMYLGATAFRKASPGVAPHNYSYVGDDYPELWEIPSLQKIGMVVEETRSYPIDGGDNALEIWATSSSKGFGYVRLGPEQRTFAVAMFHQLHCVRLIRAGLGGRYDTYTINHMHHCLNYIRQMILCSPNLTLEPADVLSRDFEVDRIGATHVCTDWSAMYDEAANNWARFKGNSST
ncbi:hypothetical protein C8R47DRAFT_1327817 [Mycena vitilis]|nr:hypothetical protein C8R47DRAFT_1327817 [Mycena vitilis]